MGNHLFSTPILFLIFNRPELTKKVFQRIREVKPKHLYVSADGPRTNKPGEAELCEQARKIVVDNIDWDCELKTRLLEKNLGCKMAVSSAITWFFENVEEGIILEDDCLPDISFFGFCAELLQYYRFNNAIMHIGGANFQDGRTRGDGSYYFSTCNHIWGWATWKRAWDKYDIKLSSFPQYLENKIISDFANSDMKKYWTRRFKLAYENKIDTWDIHWQYAMITNNGLAIIPNKNLISNIGFNTLATHTVDRFNPLANIPISPLDTIVHPSQIRANYDADIYSFRKYFSPSKLRKLYYFIKGLKLKSEFKR